MAKCGDNLLINEYKDVVVDLKLGASTEQVRDSLREMAMPLAPEITFQMQEFTLLFDTVKENCSSPEECEKIFSVLEVYSLNLIHRPWRREFQEIKTYTGVFLNMQLKLDGVFEKALEYLGYYKDPFHNVLMLKHKPKYQNLKSFAISCFVGACKFRFLGYVHKLCRDDGYTWSQVAQCKELQATAEQYVSWLKENVTPENPPKEKPRPIISVNPMNGVNKSSGIHVSKETSQNGISDIDMEDDISETDLYGHDHSNPLHEEYKKDIQIMDAQQDHFMSNHLLDLNIPLEPVKSGTKNKSTHESRHRKVEDKVRNGRSSDYNTRSRTANHQNSYKDTLRPRAEKKGKSLDDLSTKLKMDLSDTNIMDSLKYQDPKYSPSVQQRSPTDSKPKYPQETGSDDEYSLSSIKVPPNMDSITTSTYNIKSEKPMDCTDYDSTLDKYDDYLNGSSEYRTNAVRSSGVFSDQYSHSYMSRPGVSKYNLTTMSGISSSSYNGSTSSKAGIRNLTEKSDIGSPEEYLDVSGKLDKTRKSLLENAESVKQLSYNPDKYTTKPVSRSLTCGGHDLRSKDTTDARPLYSSVKSSAKSQSLPRHVELFWECNHCTTLNEQLSRVCSVCSKSRSKGNEERPLPIGGKLCDKCEFVNKEYVRKCEMCEASLTNASTNV